MKIVGWRDTETKPNCEIIESIGEAGNLNAESMRILRTYDICTESYENDDKQANQVVHECLRNFTQNIDPSTNEWSIPEQEMNKRLDLRQKRIFTIDPITA